MTVMYKKSAVLDAGSYEHLPYTEDFYLWLRAMNKGYKFANIDKVLSNDGTFFVDSSGNQAVAQYYNIISDRLQMYYDAVNKRLVIRSVSSVLIVYVTIYYTKKT